MAVSERYQDPNNPTQILQQFALYGGHRLWQGYSTENSQDNNWDQYITRLGFILILFGKIMF